MNLYNLHTENFLNDLFTEMIIKGDENMRTDIIENEKNYELLIEMPGYEKQNIKLSYDNGYLTVSANKEKLENVKFISCERKENKVSRTYYIGEIALEAIKAKLDNGVLNISIPKEEYSKKEEKRYIEIN